MLRFFFILFIPAIIHSQSLDSFVQKTAEKRSAGTTVLIARNGKVLLNQAYGFAHLGLDVKASSDTKYFAVGTGTIMITAGIMQLVEAGKLSLEDPVQKYLPDFPLQNKRVLLRHLITSTSGIPDYHYLGDPFVGLRFQPRTLDEVIALFAEEPFVIEPGEKYDWSISNYALLTAIYEKVSKQSFEQFLNKEITGPLSLTGTIYMQPNQSIKNFAQGYQLNDGNYSPFIGSLFKYDPSLRIASTTTDLYKFLSGLREYRIVNKSSYGLMTSREEAMRNRSGNMGYGIRLMKEDSIESVGVSGALEGYSSYLYYFPAADLSIIVLCNTSEQAANTIGRDIARYMLGLPPLPARPDIKRTVENIAILDSDVEKISGTYQVKRTNSIANAVTGNLYLRTLRIYYDNGQMMLQRFGEMPVPILKQTDGTYRFRLPEPVISFSVEGNKKTITFKSPNVTDHGERIGPADAKTFRHAAFLNLK
jgi:CubicO group peptidase (beta-lactamase class C family)